MRILIDECVDKLLRHLFPAKIAKPRDFAGLAGISNGKLLVAAEAAGFDVIVTVDQSIPFQQNLEGRTIVLLILCAVTNRRRDLEKIIRAALDALAAIKPGDVVRVS